MSPNANAPGMGRGAAENISQKRVAKHKPVDSLRSHQNQHDLNQQFARKVEALHQLGPRAVGCLLQEIARGRELEERLEVYARLDPKTVAWLGGDRYPPPPIRAVR
jgi:hypothetical protein